MKKHLRISWAMAGLLLAAGAWSHGSVPASAASTEAVAASETARPTPASSVATAVIETDPQALATQEATLLASHAAWVKRTVPITDALTDQWRAWARTPWASSGKVIDHDQAVVVVNRDPKVEQVAVMIAHPNAPWTLVGVSPTSTGTTGREQHFITPVGVFDHDGATLDYRAQGTKNENGIRGIGAKGSRVWDFGWQSAQTGWLKNPEMRQIRMEMHATDPDYLEPKLGHPQSKGCVRIGAGLNKFLDHYGILDAGYWAQADSSPAIRALLPKDGEPTLAGRYLIVVDELP
jgi:hypothetical protein